MIFESVIRQHPNFYIPDNLDAPLWRYFSLEKFQSLLRESALFFCRADLLGDDHEGSVSKSTLVNRPNFYAGATKHFLEKGIPEMSKWWAKCTYVSCWHVNQEESIAMWKLYASEEKGIAIKSKISLLKTCIEDKKKEFCLGPVNYIDYEKDYIPEANEFIKYFYKRNIYKHEREFRILTDKLEDINLVVGGKKEPEPGLFIPVDLSILIERVLISPYSDRETEKQVKDLLKDRNLSSRYSSSSIHRSPDF